MELREYLAIFRKQANFFFGIILAFLAIGVLFYFFQPVKYQADLTLNVTRTGQQKTADYQFDDFYRLQADERFADTVVRWLETARMQSDIQKEAGVGIGSFSLKLERLSSQMIAVEISASNPEIAEETSLSVAKAVNNESNKLNVAQQKENWFEVVADVPVISLATWAWYKIILIALALGIFIAFWAVLIRHYIEEK